MASAHDCNHMFGKPRGAFVLVLGFQESLDYEHEDDDENEPSPT